MTVRFFCFLFFILESFFYFSLIIIPDDSILAPALALPTQANASPAFTPNRNQTNSSPRQSVANQVSPDDRTDAGIHRFDHINPPNVPAAASRPTNDANEDDDDEEEQRPTAYRRIMSRPAQIAANRHVVTLFCHLPKDLSTGQGRDAFVLLMRTLKAFGFEEFDKHKGKWFERHTDSLFDENQQGIFST